MTERPTNPCYGVLQQAPTSERNTRYLILNNYTLNAVRYTLYFIREKEGCKNYGVKQKK
jgi:hypothetical protein